jgi:hypothetical protein
MARIPLISRPGIRRRRIRGVARSVITAGHVTGERRLALQVPAPVAAKALGFHHITTQRQRAAVGGTWGRYATRCPLRLLALTAFGRLMRRFYRPRNSRALWTNCAWYWKMPPWPASG